MTSIRAVSAPIRSRTRTSPPSGEYLIALSIRLVRMVITRGPSISTGTACEGSCTRSGCRGPASSFTVSPAVRTSSRRSAASRDSCSRLSSSRAVSSIWSISTLISAALTDITSRMRGVPDGSRPSEPSASIDT